MRKTPYTEGLWYNTHDEEKGIVIVSTFGTGKSFIGTNPKYSNCIIDLNNAPFKYTEASKLSGHKRYEWIEQNKGLDKGVVNPEFPQNYFSAILDAIGKYKFVLVSLWSAVEMCRASNIDYWIVVPSVDLKDEYVMRIVDRGNPKEFAQKMSDNFEYYVNRLMVCPYAKRKIILKSGEFLEDVLREYIWFQNQKLI